MSARADTYYAVLGVSPSADAAEVRRAFRRQARVYHPDLHDGHHDPRYLAVAEAYAVLGDPARRAAYDAGIRSSPPAPRAEPRSAPRDGTAFRATPTPEATAPVEPPWPYPEGPLRAPRGGPRLVGPHWWRDQSGAMRARQARTQRVWGTPGRGHRGARDDAGPLRASVDVCATTARVVAAELDDIPGLRTFHAVRSPGGVLLDHVLVCGAKIAVVVSRESTGPPLRWQRGRVLGDGGTGTAPLTLDAVRWLSSHLERENVGGWVLVYARAGATVRVGNAGSPPYLRLQTAGRGIGEIRSWLLTGNDGRMVDRVLLHRLARLTGPRHAAVDV